jgi:hypothetical protein
MLRKTGPALALGLLLVTAACGGDDDGDGDAASPRTSASTEVSADAPGATGAERTTTTATTAPPTTASPAPAPAASGSGGGGDGDADARGCAANGGRVPTNATRAVTIDVDRDGERDQVWYSQRDRQRVGVATASGLVVDIVGISAKPVIGVTVYNVDQRGPIELLVDDGALAHLYVFRHCELEPIIGPDDDPYQFDLGYLGNGTGVRCEDVDGDRRRDLTGVNFVDNGDGTATLSSTVVELDEAIARHGHHEERRVRLDPGDPHPAQPSQGVKCGSPDITAEMIDQNTPG